MFTQKTVKKLFFPQLSTASERRKCATGEKEEVAKGEIGSAETES